MIDRTVSLLSALISNACVNDGTPDSGQERRSVDTLADYLGEAGEVVEPHPGRASVVYRVEGTDPSAPRLLLLGHTDVVPANPATWRHDPFGGEVIDGVVWGRGAVDMLNQTSAMAEVYRSVAAGEIPVPPGGLAFAAVAGSALILFAAAFNDPPGTEVPDGILRVGSCVIVEENFDVREVGCTGTDDLVVDLVLPTDATCPVGLGAFRDRLGLGTVCIELD